MKDDLRLQDQINLLKQEIRTLAEKVSDHDKLSGELRDLELELRALKLFLGRHHPELKTEIPEILEKLQS